MKNKKYKIYCEGYFIAETTVNVATVKELEDAGFKLEEVM